MFWHKLLVFGATAALAARPVPKESVFTKASNDTLEWGPYRPNLYFGVKPRIPKSLLTGLMWTRVEEFNVTQSTVRYTCEQNEGMLGYGWDAYDPRTGGVQTIHDQENGIDIETSFVKFDGGAGGWAARIKGTPREDARPLSGSQGGVVDNLKTSVWFSISLEGLGAVEVDNAEAGKEFGFEGDVSFTGESQDLGDFRIRITESEDKVQHPMHGHESYQLQPLDHTLVYSAQFPDEFLWQSRTILFNSLKATLDGYIEKFTTEKMPPPWQTFTVENRPGQGNIHIVQKVFEGPFEFDVFYSPTSAKARTSADLSQEITTVEKTFAERFAKILEPQAPFTKADFARFGKSLFSNLIGGIGYFYGEQVVDRSYASEYEEENEGFWEEAAEAQSRNQQQLEGSHELFTSIPSRPFFPRGFLWDEGFHLLPIIDWDVELVMQIISSWFNTMDDNGWIAREQILGAEARSKVPSEFQVQYPHYANPPTLFLTLQALLDKVEGENPDSPSSNVDRNTVEAWLVSLYPLLERHFNWYRKTQFGNIKEYDRQATYANEAYRWRGRTPRHILTSGLDDYPRPQPPHPGELHTDLMAWMGLMSRSMGRIASFLGEADDASDYNKVYKAISRNTDDLHWSEEHKTYCDATVDDYEDHVHVCHKGYISIFPFMTGIIGPDHPHLKDILDLIGDENELWSPFGIRSLSKKNELYGTDENYWRSPVWMNMNYLVLDNLLNVASKAGPQRERARVMYGALRKNLVDTVYRSWLDTGFAWEQYNPETGAGQRTQHFTGWTSLVVKMMNMPDPNSLVGGVRDEL